MTREDNESTGRPTRPSRPLSVKERALRALRKAIPNLDADPRDADWLRWLRREREDKR